MGETISSDSNTADERSFHTHDEELRGVDLSREIAEKQFGQATVARLHRAYGEVREGADIVPATE